MTEAPFWYTLKNPCSMVKATLGRRDRLPSPRMALVHHQRSVDVFFPLLLFPGLYLRGALTFCMPCLVQLSLIPFPSSPTGFAISFQTWTTFWLGMTSHKPISLMTWLTFNDKL